MAFMILSCHDSVGLGCRWAALRSLRLFLVLEIAAHFVPPCAKLAMDQSQPRPKALSE
jgi:hypothetical protein